MIAMDDERWNGDGDNNGWTVKNDHRSEVESFSWFEMKETE